MFRQKDGIDLPNDEYTQTYQDDVGFCRLQIKDVKPDDSGLYSCIAKNENGTAKSVANLRVRGRQSWEVLVAPLSLKQLLCYPEKYVRFTLHFIMNVMDCNSMQCNVI